MGDQRSGNGEWAIGAQIAILLPGFQMEIRTCQAKGGRRQRDCEKMKTEIAPGFNETMKEMMSL
jgi:hypothetical protein